MRLPASWLAGWPASRSTGGPCTARMLSLSVSARASTQLPALASDADSAHWLSSLCQCKSSMGACGTLSQRVCVLGSGCLITDKLSVVLCWGCQAARAVVFSPQGPYFCGLSLRGSLGGEGRSMSKRLLCLICPWRHSSQAVPFRFPWSGRIPSSGRCRVRVARGKAGQPLWHQQAEQQRQGWHWAATWGSRHSRCALVGWI